MDLTRANPDIALVEALLDHLGQELCLDLARVYAVGRSQGGYLVSGLGCVLEDRIAATATATALFDLGERCAPGRPVPLLHVHGRADRHVLFDGGFGGTAAMEPVSGDGGSVLYADHPIVKALGYASIPTRMAGVAVRNGCEPVPTVEALGDDVERWVWDCPTGAEVELVVHDGGGEWPKAEPVSIEERIWEFLEQHPMPE